ncbi:MAG: glutamine synthetase, partial [Chloroflexi bacterium]|nr:glutamine synthetase [Chloroflexota bacterium]
MVRERPRRRAGRAGTANPVQRAIELARDNGVQMVDLKFVDLPGTWQHFTIPVSELNEKLFEVGTGFDGSSIRGFQEIHESDMLVVPDPTTAAIDPFFSI